LVGISLAVDDQEGYYLPIGHRTGEKQLPLSLIQEKLGDILKNPAKGKTGHHLKYDCIVLSQNGLPVGNLAFDTMIAGWLIDPGSRRLGLKEMAAHYLSQEMTHIEELIGSGKNQRSMADVPVQQAAAYAAADAVVPLRLQPVLQEKLEKDNAIHLFKQMEMPLIPVLMEMEQTGIMLDIPFFEEMSAELNRKMGEIEQQIYASVGQSFNINSTQQLAQILFNVLRIPPPQGTKKTASGQYSTSADVLDELRGSHPVVDMVLEYRELAKLNSTYVEALPRQVNPKTGRVHTSFNQTGSVTGRLASSNPNLQNIPTRTEIGSRVRQGFIASAGMTLLAVDYSQIELRIVAHMSGDGAMLEAFRAGQDIHAATAAAIYYIPIDQVTKEQRRHAKAINFGLIYGMSAFGLTRSTDLTLAEAEKFVDAYFRQFPGVKRYLLSIRQEAAEKGYVETLFGRRRYFTNLRSSNATIRNREEREAINAPIQGTAADIIKIAMCRLSPALRQAGLEARLLLQVHDELILECPQEQLKPTAKVVQEVMESACTLSIPLLTEARHGHNWGSLSVLQG